MDRDDRTYSKSEIRERRRELSQLVALQQRQLDALAKMDEAAEELDQVEREMAALARGETGGGQPAEAVSAEPQMTGERALAILRDHAGTWLTVRDVLTDMLKRGWAVDTETERARVMQTLRHSLRRLALHNDHVERNGAGTTFYYRYVVPDSDVLVAVPSAVAPVPRANGVALPAYQGGPNHG